MMLYFALIYKTLEFKESILSFNHDCICSIASGAGKHEIASLGYTDA